MKLLANTGTERVVDELRATLVAGSTLDIATPALSVFAFGELRDLLNQLKNCRLVLPPPSANGLGLLGAEADRPYRNRLQTRWLATELATWLEAAAEVRAARGAIPQSALIATLGAEREQVGRHRDMFFYDPWSRHCTEQ